MTWPRQGGWRPIRYSLVRTTAPTQLPVTMAELREQLSLHEDEQHYDQLIRRLALAATESVEAETGRQLMSATYTLTLDRLPSGSQTLTLPKPPLASVTSITVDGSVWSSANYTVDTAFPGRVYPVSTTEWPTVDADFGGVVIVYVAGESDRANVPDVLRHAILLLVGHWFQNREAVVIGTISSELPIGVKRLISNASYGEEFEALWHPYEPDYYGSW